MERVARQQQNALEVLGPASRDKLQIKPLIRPVDLVAYDWVAERRQMDADLMSAAGVRNCANDCKLVPRRSRSCEALLHRESGGSRRSGRMNCLFQPNRRSLVCAFPSKRRFNEFPIPCGPAPNDREIFLLDLLALHHQPELARGLRS